MSSLHGLRHYPVKLPCCCNSCGFPSVVFRRVFAGVQTLETRADFTPLLISFSGEEYGLIKRQIELLPCFK